MKNENPPAVSLVDWLSLAVPTEEEMRQYDEAMAKARSKTNIAPMNPVAMSVQNGAVVVTSSAPPSHSAPERPSAREVCRYEVAGNCAKGSSCRYSHDLRLHPCMFLYGGGQCFRGETCRFGHNLTLTPAQLAQAREAYDQERRWREERRDAARGVVAATAKDGSAVEGESKAAEPEAQGVKRKREDDPVADGDAGVNQGVVDAQTQRDREKQEAEQLGFSLDLL